MSHRQPAARSSLPRHLLVLGVAAALLLGAGPAGAQNRAAGPKPEDDPGGHILAEVQPLHLALLTLGAAAQPQLGACEAATFLRLGEHSAFRVWTIEDPRNNPKTRALIGAGSLLASLAGDQKGWTELALFEAGDKFNCWTLIDTLKVRHLPGDLLLRVRDERPIPKPQENDLELDAYYTMLIWAGETAESALQKAARRDVTYRHLFEEPKKYRGEVVFLRGKLKRLIRYDAPQHLREAGFPDLYEGWIFDEVYGANPFCVLFTELPRDVPVGEKLDLEVSFAGYFYKKYRYRAGDNFKANERRDAPLLIGRTLVRLTPAAPAGEEENWGKGLVPLFLGLIIATAGFVLVLALWFRHNDRRVQRRLAGVRNQEFVLPTPDGEIPSAGEVTNPPPVPTERGEENGTGPAPPSPGEPLLRSDRPGL
jgi:hypothetical protein